MPDRKPESFESQALSTSQGNGPTGNTSVGRKGNDLAGPKHRGATSYGRSASLRTKKSWPDPFGSPVSRSDEHSETKSDSVPAGTTCPRESPTDVKERRIAARDWFSAAETAENTGDDVRAVQAYACSYKMIPHPYTAFNLARVAERTGESDLALKMHRAYLVLRPDAPDEAEVKEKILALQTKVDSDKVGTISP